MKCGFLNDLDAYFCENCGCPVARTCSACGAALKPETRFCKKCGLPTSFDHEGLSVLQQTAPSELQEKMRAVAKQMEGERRSVTILFTDIVGSTALAEKLDPEEWRKIVTGAHESVSQAVYRYEGTIAQLLGDGVLAFFGAPVAHEDDPLRAILAALDIQHAMGEYEHMLQGYLESFQVRIGLNTGLVVVGSVGNNLHMEYLAIGDAVNLAARLQAAAEPGQVLISESTARLVEAAISLTPLGEISVKGRSTPVAVFQVGENRVTAASRRGFTQLRSPLVGREAELEALQGALQQLNAGLGGIVAITGEPGIGKSRLVEEACHMAGNEWQSSSCQNLRWLEGRALSYGQKLSFWTIRQLLQNDLDLSDSDPELKIRLALHKRVVYLFGEDADSVLPYLARLMGVQLDGHLADRIGILDGETLKYQTLVSITRYFCRLAEMQPTVMVFDDLQWADPSSLQALEDLLALTDRAPILLLLLSRLEREHESWQLKLKAGSQYAHRYTDLELKPLPIPEQNTLVDNLLVVSDLPEAVRRRILERADGNPLFLEEIVRDLVEQGVFVRDKDGWRASGDILDITIPETLCGVLLARIDRLQEDVRRTLQLASVIGKSFLYRLLEAIAEARTKLDGHLAQLQRADLVREKSRLPELEYIFKHSLTQEAAYSSLLLEQRRVYHRQVARSLESLFKGRETEFAGLLAHHYDAASDREQAVKYLLLAGDKARLEYAFEEAQHDYLRLIELLEELGDQEGMSRTWYKLGLVHQSKFEFEQAQRAYEKAFSLQRQAYLLKKSIPYQVPSGRGRVLRQGEPPIDPKALDPGYSDSSNANEIVNCLFAGLVEYDLETNIMPHAARSWEVQDGGLLYIFHLRDDNYWTDGTSVTAADFEWAWKRNLAPGEQDFPANMLDVVLGARAYRSGANPDPDCVGVHALDPLTLEVRLESPATYFIYLTAHPVTYPLPAHIVTRYGQDWWKPSHGVYNGPFQLVEYSTTGLRLQRNPSYFGDFPGNLDGIEMHFIEFGDKEMQLRFLDKQLDLCVYFYLEGMNIPIPPELLHYRLALDTSAMVLNPVLPPLNDCRVRQAIAQGLDFKRIMESYRFIGGARRSGGLLPPGMMGHSPELGLPYNLPLARQLLAQAGFPDGKGFPVLNFCALGKETGIDEMVRQLAQNLGIQCDLQIWPFLSNPRLRTVNLIAQAWVADYPDPDNFLRASFFITFLKETGWRNPHYDSLIAEASLSRNQLHRMKLYREADRILVNDEAVIIPFMHSISGQYLIHPWVSGCEINALDMISYKCIRLEQKEGLNSAGNLLTLTSNQRQ